MKASIFYTFCVFIVVVNALVSSKKFMASLRIKGKHFCCGFLLTRRIVMSTGFCVNYIKLHGGTGFNDSTVYVGNVNFTARFAKKIVKVHHVNYHPRYNPKDPIYTSDFDVGYVLLAETLKNWYAISTISLSKMDFDPPFLAKTYGWGCKKINDPLKNQLELCTSSVLKEVYINITTAEPCKIALHRNLNPNEYCGIRLSIGDAISQGDTGSPMIKYHSRKVIGFTSIVNILGKYNPTVFVRASYFTNYTNYLKNTFPEEEPNYTPRQNQPNEQPGHDEQSVFKYASAPFELPDHREASAMPDRIEVCESRGHSEPSEHERHSESPGHPAHIKRPGHDEPSVNLGHNEPSERSGHDELSKVPNANGDNEMLDYNEPCELSHLYEFYEQPDLNEALNPLG